MCDTQRYYLCLEHPRSPGGMKNGVSRYLFEFMRFDSIFWVTNFVIEWLSSLAISLIAAPVLRKWTGHIKPRIADVCCKATKWGARAVWPIEQVEKGLQKIVSVHRVVARHISWAFIQTPKYSFLDGIRSGPYAYPTSCLSSFPSRPNRGESNTRPRNGNYLWVSFVGEEEAYSWCNRQCPALGCKG